MIFYKDKFKVLRKKQRLSITALSKLTNISRQSISKWENGKAVPSEKKIKALAKALEIIPNEISDIPKQYPISKKKISDITKVLENQKDTLEFKDKNIQTILSCLKQINDRQTTTEMLLKAILQNSENILYLKDMEQKYILVSNSFLKILSLPANYNVEGKKDTDFYINKEALDNFLEDKQVLTTGTPINNIERHIYGTQKQKYGSFSKFPVLDEENKIAGVVGLIQNITKQKKYEKQIKAINYAVSQLDKVIWLAKGINGSIREPQLFNELIFTTNTTAPPKGGNNFWGEINPNDLDNKQIMNIWRSGFTENTKECFIKTKKKLKFPMTRYYNLISPITKKEVWVTENINYDKNNDYFTGTISFNLNLIKQSLMNEVLNEVPNIIVWIGNICDNKEEFKYQFLSNTKSITEYEETYFLDGKLIIDLAVDTKEKNTIIQYFMKDKFPFTHQYDIKTKTGKKKALKSFFYKVGKDSIAASTYYGFHLLID